MKHLFTLFLGLWSMSAWAQTETEHIHYLADPNAAERQHSVDITHMKVDVRFEPEARKVIGRVTHSFVTLQKGIDTLFFDAPGITINSATLDGADVPFTINPEGVVLRFKNALSWDEVHTVVFDYSALPKRGIYFIGWNQPENPGAPDINYIRKQIWTQGQGIDNRHWIPMYDNMNDKFTTETVVKMPKPYKVLSNGKKIDVKENSDGSQTWHYIMERPHAGYLLMLGIGIYEVKETKTKRGTPVQFWYYPEFKDRLEPTSIHTEKMIELLEDETGTPYPWGTYSQIMVQNFLYGAMENTSATIFGDFFTVDARGFKDRNYMGVNCHELTHQWFGDLITARSGNDVWLQESFATFFPKLFFKDLEGDDAYQWSVRGEYNAALAQSKKDNFPVRHTQGGTTRLYPKGSAVLSMLRYQLGEDNLRRFIQHYLAVNSFKNVESWDFQKAIKDKLGLNYDWFFDQWIHRGGEPHFNVSYKSEAQSIDIRVQQIHKVDGHVRYFKAPVNFAVYYKNGKVDRQMRWVLDSADQTISIPNVGGDISFVLFDEHDQVMKKMNFKKSDAELFAQAAGAQYMIDRYDAIAAMDSMAIDKKVDFLQKRFAIEKHFAIRAEIARQLANQKSLVKWYSNVLKDSKSEVKNAFIAADTTVDMHKSVFVALLKDSSNVVVENALDKLMTCKTISEKEKAAYLKSTQHLGGQNNNIRTKWLEYAYNNTKDEALRKQYVDELTRLCGPTYEFRTRVNAANALKRLNVFNQQMAKNLVDACLEYNSRLSGPCVDVLKELKKYEPYNNVLDTVLSSLSEEDRGRMRVFGL